MKLANSPAICDRNLKLKCYGFVGQSQILAVFLMSSALFAAAQISPSPLTTRHNQSEQQQSVSRNLLATPGKARKAVELAGKDLLAGHYADAEKHVQKALHVFPNCANALLIEGLLKSVQADDAGAARLFQQATDADPTLGAAYVASGELQIRERHFKEALVSLNRASQFLPNSWIVFFQTAVAHMGVGDFHAALLEVSFAEHSGGDNPEMTSAVSLVRGLVYGQLKDYGNAKTNLDKAIKSEPNGYYAGLAQKELKRLSSSVAMARNDPGK